MIHINEGQAQLSGWGYSAVPKALFINKVPEPFMVGQTISAAATRDRGGTTLVFEDGTRLHYHQGYGLFPPLTDVTVWTVPAEGTTVSNTLEYVEINASYTTKSGKVIKAIPVKVPVAVPSYIRVISPTEPMIKEGTYRAYDSVWEDRPPYLGVKRAFHLEDVKLMVYWADSHGNIIKITEAEDTPEHQMRVDIGPGWSGSSSSGPYFDLSETTETQTITRYRSATDSGVQMTIENAIKFRVYSYVVNGVTISSDWTYFRGNPIVSWGYFNLRTSYSGETRYTIDIYRNSKVKFKDGTVMIGTDADDNHFHLRISMRYKVLGGWWEYRSEETITLKDGAYGTIYQYCLETYRDNQTLYKVQNRYFSCEDGEVTWTTPPEE